MSNAPFQDKCIKLLVKISPKNEHIYYDYFVRLSVDNSLAIYTLFHVFDFVTKLCIELGSELFSMVRTFLFIDGLGYFKL